MAISLPARRICRFTSVGFEGNFRFFFGDWSEPGGAYLLDCPGTHPYNLAHPLMPPAPVVLWLKHGRRLLTPYKLIQSRNLGFIIALQRVSLVWGPSFS